MKIQWSEGRGFPTLIKGGAMGIVGGVPVYAAGVSHPWRETELCWAFDSVVQDWVPIRPLPLGRCYTSGATVGDGLIIVGGRKSTKEGFVSLEDAWLLRRTGDDWQWSELPNLTQRRAEGTVTAVRNLAVCVGGGEWERKYGGAFTANDVTIAEALNLDNLQAGWINLGEPLFSPRVGCAAAAVDGCVYLFGGYNCWLDERNERHLEYFNQTFRYECSANRWTEVSPMPVKLSGHKAVAFADRYIILMGGVVRFSLLGQELQYQTMKVDSKRGVLLGEYSDLVWVYDTQTDSYDLLAGRMPHGHNDLRACIKKDTIYVVGGENCDATTSNTTNTLMIGEIDEIAM
ncbi:MAG: hypothetical protein HY318_01715 [Armatimonadetes bacterium]|nr:hypothetical protein [Armatimonadota bacterium]